MPAQRKSSAAKNGAAKTAAASANASEYNFDSDSPAGESPPALAGEKFQHFIGFAGRRSSRCSVGENISHWWLLLAVVLSIPSGNFSVVVIFSWSLTRQDWSCYSFGKPGNETPIRRRKWIRRFLVSRTGADVVKVLCCLSGRGKVSKLNWTSIFVGCFRSAMCECAMKTGAA